ncbi:MAG: DUF1232 domain-containing protein [Myroides sp.]
MQENKSNKVFPIILAALGAVYGISPVDILPDVIPIAGWIDDLVITGGTLLNLVQSYVKDSNKFFASVLGFIKWILWILGGILIALIGLLGVTIYNLFS